MSGAGKVSGTADNTPRRAGRATPLREGTKIDFDNCAKLLATHTKARIQSSVPATTLTTYCIGGPIALLVEPDSIAELVSVIEILGKEGLGYRTLGGGSNLLVSDAGISQDVVIRLGRGLRILENLGSANMKVGGAYSLMTLSRSLSDDGLSGLEFAGGIPASVGGAMRMNAGAHGGQFGDLVERVTFVESSGEIVTWQKSDLILSYRQTNIPLGAIVASVELSLEPSDRETTVKLRAEHLAERKKRQPLMAPSAGSVFKNPSPDRSAGMLIEQAGLKGRIIGGAKISELHGNWIVNEQRRATYSDVVALIELAQNQVQERLGVTLEPEVVRWE